MGWMTLPAFVVAISVLVAVHEYGHYWVARRLGFKVVRFSIGFGKPLWKRVAGADQTEYVIAAIPLGGYVKLLDEREGPVEAPDLPRSFMRKPVWQRLLVLFAGPTFNFLFAIVAYWALFIYGVPQSIAVVGNVRVGSHAAQAGLRFGDEIRSIDGKRVPDQKTALYDLLESVLDDGEVRIGVRGLQGGQRDVLLSVGDAEARRKLTEPGELLTGIGFEFQRGPAEVSLDEVGEGQPAARAGLEAGDRILRVDGKEPRNGDDLREAIESHAGQPLAIVVERDGTERSVTVDVEAKQEEGKTVGRIGIKMKEEPPRVRAAPVAAFGQAVGETWEMSRLTVSMLWNMVMGRVSVKNISGPINIAAFAGETARRGLDYYLGFLAIVSVSLGILNLLPIPILDGGQIMFQVVEFLKGSPLSERAQLLGQQVGIALLLLLMSLAFYNDISSHFAN